MSDAMVRLNAALSDRYRIERELGAGGMATVYLAEDLRHKRKVALKVLKPELAAVLGGERFVQEITTTASLQHPHILPLFDSGTADSFLFYVMPYIEGETLREKLDRETQLGIDEAVRITREVADALDYAHRQGVIHRDIKPENILLHDGRPMVADFGIALAVSAAAGGRMTETGTSVGTPHYMSPEQATGDKQITGRADIYSLASVLYEMLAGQPPHTGGSAQQVIMRIIADTPRVVTELRKSVPSNVAAAVMTALEKLPADRFESAKAFADALANPAFVATGARGVRADGRTTHGVPRVAFAGVAALALVATVAALWGWMRDASGPAGVVRYEDLFLTDSLEGNSFGRPIALSPDGQRIAYRGGGARNAGLYLRSRSQLTGVAIPGSEGGTGPFFSPDGRRLGFCVRDGFQCTLKVVTLPDGAPQTLATYGFPVGLSWSTDGSIYLGSRSRGIQRISEAGGEVRAFTTVDTAAGEVTHELPFALPGARGVLFVVDLRTTDRTRDPRLAVALPDGSHRLLGIKGLAVSWASSGHVLYVTGDGTLMAVPFDLDALAIRGEPAVVGQVSPGTTVHGPVFDVSETGTLLYLSGNAGEAPDETVWLNRQGVPGGADPWTADFSGIALAPDGQNLAVGIRENQVVEIWVRQGEAAPVSRLTFAADGEARFPAWTRDGRYVTWIGSDGQGAEGVWRRRADGSAPAEILVSGLPHLQGLEWTPGDSALILTIEEDAADRNLGLFLFRPGRDTLPAPLLDSPFNESQPAISPDGRWLAYVSDESGELQVYARPFPDVNASRVQVTSRPARDPAWTRRGELIYLAVSAEINALDAEIAAVDVIDGPSFSFGEERVLFSDATLTYWDVSDDGDRFAVVRARRRLWRSVVLVDNWFTELNARVPR